MTDKDKIKHEWDWNSALTYLEKEFEDYADDALLSPAQVLEVIRMNKRPVPEPKEKCAMCGESISYQAPVCDRRDCYHAADY